MFCAYCGAELVGPGCGCYTSELERKIDDLQAEIKELEDYRDRVVPDLKKEASDWRSRYEHVDRCDTQRAEKNVKLRASLEKIRSSFPGSKLGYEAYAKESHRIANEALNG